jgi:glycerol uptake facilitator-like aquaporin
MESRLRTYLAELFGTFLVVLLGAGTICGSYLPANDPRYYTAGGVTLAAALAYGIALAIAVTASFQLSPGCCNPAITLALFVNRRLDLARMAGLIAAQLVGAFLGGLAIRALFDDNVLIEARMGSPHLKALLGQNDALTLGALTAGVGVEFVLTLFVALAAFVTLFDRRAPKLGGFGLGLAQIAAVLFGFHLTGGSANPAVWFGPAIWQLSLSIPPSSRPLGDHAVYWLGPILGALAASVFYTLVVMPEKHLTSGE